MAGQYRFKDQNGNIVAQISASVGGAIAFSGSVVDFSQANNVILGNVQLAGTASNALLLDGFDSQAFAFTSSIHPFTASIAGTNTFTSSAKARLDSIETISSSNVSRLNSLEIKTGSLATTGSNVFIGTQTITGSLFISSNLIVQGTSSLQNITASAVSIGTNIVNLNTANPAIRYAGLVIGDSGSIGSSGSFLYDSVQDEMIFVHRGANTTVTSSVVLMGPQTYDNIGNEIYPTSNIIQKGTGNEHLIDSCIFDNGTTTCVKNNLIGTGTINSVGLLTGQSSIYQSDANGLIASNRWGNYNGGSTAMSFFYNASGNVVWDNGSPRMVLTNTGDLGIGVSAPQSIFHIIKALGSDVIKIGEADANTRFAIGQEAGYTGNYINSRNIDLKLQAYCAGGSGGNIHLQTGTDGSGCVTTKLLIALSGVATFNCQVCAPSFIGGTVTGTRMTVATDCSGVIVDVAGRHGLMKYFNYSTGLVGACSGTDGNISTWLGRFAGSITAPTAVYQDLMINGNGRVTIGTACSAFGRALTAYYDVVAYFSDQENITMGLSAGTGQQSWGIQVCDTGDGGSALHLNARGGNVGINKGNGNAASHALDVTGVINSTDRVQAPQIVASVHKFTSTSANTFNVGASATNIFNINIAGTTGLQVGGNYQTSEITFQAGLYPGATTVIGKILVVNRGGAFSCSYYASAGVGGIGTIGIVPYSNGSNTFGVCLTSDCTSSAVYWSAIVNAMSV